MPELPDVAVFARYLESNALNRRVTAVRASDERLAGKGGAGALAERMEGRYLVAARRHGKHLFTRLDDEGWLEWHFGMTGHLDSGSAADPEPSTGHVRLTFDDGGRLDLFAPRKLGHIQPVADPDAFIGEQGLGVDALDPSLNSERFAGLAAHRRKAVKCWLIDQGVIAGIGNLYSDEILFQARLHPRRRVSDLDQEALEGLRDHMDRVLRTAIEAGAEPAALPAGYLLPQRKVGASCPRCGGPLAGERVCGRTAWLCPVCQPPP